MSCVVMMSEDDDFVAGPFDTLDAAESYLDGFPPFLVEDAVILTLRTPSPAPTREDFRPDVP